MKIEVTGWKKFSIGEIFYKHKVTKFSSMPDSTGNIALITSTSVNNGVAKYVDEKPIASECITVSTNGACFDCFYHPYPIVISTDVEILKNDNLNSKNALFICTILSFEKYRWNYGRKPKNNKVFETIIKLPSDKNGDPDWDFMSCFIETFNSDLPISKNKPFNHNLNRKKFKLFRLGDLITRIYNAKPHIKRDTIEMKSHEKESIPFVSRTELNNSVDFYASKASESGVESGNALVIGDTTATISYQENEFMAGDHILVIRANWLNKYTGLYIVSILKKEKYRYSYGRAFKKELIEDTMLNLPERNGEPDWEFIESFIKELPNGDLI